MSEQSKARLEQLVSQVHSSRRGFLRKLLIGSAAIGFLAVAGAGNGPLGSFFAELYRTHYRYTAAALSYNIGSVLGGGIPPLVIASLVASYGVGALPPFLVGVGVVSLVCLFLLTETRTRKLDADAPVLADRGGR